MNSKQQHRQIGWYRLKRIFKRTFVVVSTFLLFVNTLLQVGAVQSYIAQKASEYLSEQLGIHIEIEKVRITLMMDVLLKGVRIDDAHQNKMITIKYFYARLSAAQLTNNVFRLSEVEMIEGGFTLRKYQGERFYNYTDLIGKPDTTREKSSDIAFELYCKNSKMTNCYFNMVNENNPSRNGFDWNNMYLKLHKVEARNLSVNNDEVSVDFRNITVSDTSGFQVNKFTTVMRFANDGWYFDDAFILTPKSTLDFDLKFGYSSFDYIGQFEDSITIIADLRPSILAINDVAYFTESLKNYPVIAEIETKFNGSLHNFTLDDFKLKTGNDTDLSMNAHVKGIMDPETAYMKVSIDHLTTSFSDIQNLNIPIGDLSLPPPLFNPFSLSLFYEGSISKFESDIVVQTAMGSIAAQLNMNHSDTLHDYRYDGFISGNKINIGLLSGIAPEILGKCSFNMTFNGSGLSFKNANVNVNATIDSLDAMQYTYRNIHVDGILEDLMFNGLVKIEDKYVNLHFEGLMNFQDSLPLFNFSANLKDVYLTKLHLIERDEDLHLSSNITVRARGFSIDDIRGNITIDNFRMIESDSLYAFNTLKIITFQDTITKERNIKVRSDLLDANLSGDFQLSNLDNAFEQFIGNHIASIRSFADTTEINPFDLSYNLIWDITLKDISPITRFLIPDLHLPDGLTASQDIDFEEDKMKTKCNASIIIYNGIRGTDFYLNAATQSYGTTGEIGFSKISIIEKDDSTVFGLEDFMVNTLVKNDSIKYSISWDRLLGEQVDISYLDGQVSFIYYPMITVNFSDMSTVLKNEEPAWHVEPDNTIIFDSLGIVINHLKFYSEKSSIFFDGSISNNDSSSLKVELHQGDISVLNKILNLSGINTYGSLSGAITFNNPYNNFSVTSDLTIDEWKINDNALGNATLHAEWDSENPSAYINLNSVLSESLGDVYPIFVQGHYYPKNLDKNFDIKAKIENLNLDILNPFLNEYVTKIKGYVSGELNVVGTQENPQINGGFSIQRGSAHILYTGMTYSLTGKIIANNKDFSFQDFILNDTIGNKASLDGEIRHKGFTDFYMDLALKPKNFLLFNTKRFDNDVFYGTIRTTGNINATGPFNDIKVTAQISTDKGTEIIVPLNTAESIETSTFVIFTKPVDSTTVVQPSPLLSSSSGLDLNLSVNVNPDGNIIIYLPGDAGKISASGDGDIALRLDNSNNFGLFGKYVIQKGTFNLTIQQLNINIINKTLSLNRGSYIQFNGDPLDASMNVSATYEVQTSLENLNVITDSIQAQKRIPVNCIIHMREKLSDPELHFSIEFPTLHDEDMRSRIYAKIDTTNDAEMTRQAFSLLLLGTFTSDEFSGSASSMVANSSISMLTNQVNNWLSQMVKGVDIGVNYRSGDQVTSDEFDIFVRKGMFNDRVIIDANVGSTTNANDNNRRSSTTAIDASLEIKITERWSFKAFNRSNANDISKVGTNNEYGYTYGIGASYNKNFNNVKEIFTNPKRKQKKEEKMKTVNQIKR